jgi:hypothetical protein
MFDEHQKGPAKPSWVGPKILIGAATAMLLSFGLCGIGQAVQKDAGIGVLGMLGIYLFGISVLAILIGGVITSVEVIIAIGRRK